MTEREALAILQRPSDEFLRALEEVLTYHSAMPASRAWGEIVCRTFSLKGEELPELPTA